MRKNILTLIPFLITIACGIAFNIIGSEVLPDGTLQESFYLIPIAWLFLMVGIIAAIVRVILSSVLGKK